MMDAETRERIMGLIEDSTFVLNAEELFDSLQDAGVTQARLAKICGVSRSAVTQWKEHPERFFKDAERVSKVKSHIEKQRANRKISAEDAENALFALDHGSTIAAQVEILTAEYKLRAYELIDTASLRALDRAIYVLETEARVLYADSLR